MIKDIRIKGRSQKYESENRPTLTNSILRGIQAGARHGGLGAVQHQMSVQKSIWEHQ